MSLLRFVARSLFAGQFIAEGVKALAHPDDVAEDSARVAGTVAPVVQRVLPAHLASSVPDRPQTWARLVGGAQVAGGAMLATGLGRRLGAATLVGTSALELIAAWPGRQASAAAKEEARALMIRRASLLGGALLSSMDTEGKPGLAWRADQAVKTAGKKADEAVDSVTKAASAAKVKADKKTQKVAKQARREARKLGKKLDAVTTR